MDVDVTVVGRGSVNDGKSKIQLTLTSDDMISRNVILSLSRLILNQGDIRDGATIAAWLTISADEVEIGKQIIEADEAGGIYVHSN